MIGIFRNQPPTKSKFSYATAQQYCELIKKSIDRVNSQSKKNLSPAKITLKMPAKPNDQYKRQPAYKKLRQRIRSRSNSNQESSQQSRSLSLCQKTNLNSNNPSTLMKEVQPQPRKVNSYQQQHLLGTLSQENQQLKSAIKLNQTKAQKMKQRIEQQRNGQNIQREFYEQQVKKLKQKLQLQLKYRKQAQNTQQQCSIEEITSSITAIQL